MDSHRAWLKQFLEYIDNGEAIFHPAVVPGTSRGCL
jgi:hypothetical protein